MYPVSLLVNENGLGLLECDVVAVVLLGYPGGATGAASSCGPKSGFNSAFDWKGGK